MRTFQEWYNSIPYNLKEHNQNNGKIYEINKILKKLEESEELKNKKPTVEEIKHWINTNQI